MALILCFLLLPLLVVALEQVKMVALVAEETMVVLAVLGLLVKEITVEVALLGFLLHLVAEEAQEVLAGMESIQPPKQEMAAQVFAQS